MSKLADRAWRAAVVVLFTGFFVWLSHRAGVPKKLPGAAFDWRLLFHFERAAALLGTAGVVLLVGWRAVHGKFPIKLGQVEYAQEQAEATFALNEAQERRLKVLEVLSGIRNPADIQEGP